MTSRTLMLSADLDRTNVAMLAHEGAEILATGGVGLTLDGSAVGRVRLCAVQMIASAAKSAAAARVPFVLENASPELVEALRLCGLADLAATGGEVTA